MSTREEIIEMAVQAGLRQHIPFWSDSEVADALEAFAKLVEAKRQADIDPSSFMSYQEGVEAGRMAERERIKEEQQRCYVVRGDQ